MPITLDDITITSFPQLFEQIIEDKERVGLKAIQNNPPDLLKRAQEYGTQFKNGSWNWASNIWNRSAAGSVVIEREEDLLKEHKVLMLRVLEHILDQPMIQADAMLGQQGSKGAMNCRLYCDAQFPDVAYRWQAVNFPGNQDATPDALCFMIPHYLENPNVPGKDEMLKVIRFPFHDYTIVTASSYMGEAKKGFLSHWIYEIYKRGGTGEHASLKEFTVKRVDGRTKRMVMSVWGLTGSGKSTHGHYVYDDRIAQIYIDKFGINPLEFISDQSIRNDDVVGVFEDCVVSPERGCWTKTEDVDVTQHAIYNAGTSPRALHENTEWDESGDVSFRGEILQYHGKLNQNARSIIFLEDTGYFNGNVDSSGPLNMAVFISPGYISDYAWVKLNDPAFAAKVLADGRTIGHPAQGREGVGGEKYESRYCLPFTMGVGNAAHVHRFHKFMIDREGTDNPIESYLINTTGRVGAKYVWTDSKLGDETVWLAKTLFEEVKGKKKPVGGTGPTIEETQLFLIQAARGSVEYEPHPFWGDKVLVPAHVEGLSPDRLKQLDPFTYRTTEEMEALLREQIVLSKYYLKIQCPRLNKRILGAMDF
ncbi:MAG: phosphoenolpyruvate carboxykinase (ATP) [Halobacteriota archaeon]